jgi:mannose-1-phosphate guanylyltransferase
MAGGSGTRFWPASNEQVPKQFLKIVSDNTLIEDTLARISPLVADKNIFVIVNQLHQDLTRDILRDKEIQILAEPVGRNTAACIGLGAIHATRIDADAPMIILPADHHISDVEAFKKKLKNAAYIARSGVIVTLGIVPTRPETGYGYIELNDEVGFLDYEKIFHVRKFVEKPDSDTAKKYVTDGRHFWNGGIFVFTPKVILNEIKTHLPELFDGLAEIAETIGTDRYEETLNRIYPQLPSISIDYGVMEKTLVPIRTLCCDFGWSDVGSWQSLYELRRQTDSPNVLMADTVVIESKNNLIYSTSKRKVALLGIEGIAVIDTPEALLIADLKRSQEVKRVTEILKSAE